MYWFKGMFELEHDCITLRLSFLTCKMGVIILLCRVVLRII